MTKKLWGGRFAKGTDLLVEGFTRSIQYDHKLADYDLIGSLAHIQILKKAGYLTAAEKSKLEKGLKTIAFCAIGTGIAGFPMDRCAQVMLRLVVEHLKGKTSLQAVHFVLYGKEALETFKAELAKV